MLFYLFTRHNEICEEKAQVLRICSSKKLHKNYVLLIKSGKLHTIDGIGYFVNCLTDALSEWGNLRQVVYICYEFQFILYTELN